MRDGKPYIYNFDDSYCLGGNYNPALFGRLVMTEIPEFVRKIMDNVDESLIPPSHKLAHIEYCGFKMNRDDIISQCYNSVLA